MATVITNGNGHTSDVGGFRSGNASAEPVLALLEEDDDYLKAHALRALNQGNNIMNHWHEVAEYVAEIEALSEVRRPPPVNVRSQHSGVVLTPAHLRFYFFYLPYPRTRTSRRPAWREASS